MAVRYLNATGTQALINEIKSRLANKADVASIQAILAQIAQLSNTIPTKVSQLDNDEGFIDRTTADELYATATQLSNISDVVNQNQTAINLLNSDDQTPGSVDYKIAQAIEGGGGSEGGIVMLTSTLLYNNAAENVPIDISATLNSEILGLAESINAFLLRAFGPRAGGTYYHDDIILCWRSMPKSGGDKWQGLCLFDPQHDAEGSGPYPFTCEIFPDPDIPGTFTWWSLSSNPTPISQAEIEALF